VVAGGQVGLEAGLDPQVGVPKPVHRQDQLELLGVDLDQARVGGDAQEEDDREQRSAGLGLRARCDGTQGRPLRFELEAASWAGPVSPATAWSR
jgi:hypothetical protein